MCVCVCVCVCVKDTFLKLHPHIMTRITLQKQKNNSLFEHIF